MTPRELEKQKTYRRRNREGIVCRSVPFHEVSVVQMLVRFGVLSDQDMFNPKAQSPSEKSD
jgi:hypothetical protein